MQIWLKKEQNYTSKNTSINSQKLPRTIKIVENIISPGDIWLDIGGVKYNNLIDFFHKKNANLFVYDPFNRSDDYNLISIEKTQNSQADGVMVNNVLNVIQEQENRLQV